MCGCFFLIDKKVLMDNNKLTNMWLYGVLNEIKWNRDFVEIK